MENEDAHILPGRDIGKENAGEEKGLGVFLDGEPAPLAPLRTAAVGSDDEACGNPLSVAIGCSYDNRLLASLNALDRHAPPHFRANPFPPASQPFPPPA